MLTLPHSNLETDVILSIKTDLSYSSPQGCDVLLQIEPGDDATQRCLDSRLTLTDSATQTVLSGEDGIGTRRWAAVGPQFACHFETRVSLNRPAVDLQTLRATPHLQIPAPVVNYLMPSRYCHSDLFLDFVTVQFDGLSGGALVGALSDWISVHFTYDSAASYAGMTATDSFHSLSGVCRDYAHVLIAFVRAAGIPARYVSAYAPDVTPQDFHAVVEVYLDGGWHLVDPTGMSRPEETVRICIGRDAADASFLTSYGRLDLQTQTVAVRRVAG